MPYDTLDYAVQLFAGVQISLSGSDGNRDESGKPWVELEGEYAEISLSPADYNILKEVLDEAVSVC